MVKNVVCTIFCKEMSEILHHPFYKQFEYLNWDQSAIVNSKKFKNLKLSSFKKSVSYTIPRCPEKKNWSEIR